MGRGEWEMREGKGEKKGGRRGAGPTTKKSFPHPWHRRAKITLKCADITQNFDLKIRF